jgi:hypothetical protein
MNQSYGEEEDKRTGSPIPLFFPHISLCVQYIPGLVLLLVTVSAIAVQQVHQLPFLFIGAYSAWLYLRFFQQQPDSTAVVS